MATISTVTLAINGALSGSKSVQVQGTMNFTAEDIGKKYQLAIKLVGIDKGDDPAAANDPGGDNDLPIHIGGPATLYTFQFGAFPFAKPFRSITVTEAGTKTFSETRTITNNTLDEDTGHLDFGGIPPIPGPPKGDEIRADVALTLSARSNVVHLGVAP